MARVVRALESELLGEGLITVGCEEHVNSGALSGEEETRVRPHLESVTFLVSTSAATNHHHLRHGALGTELPLTRDFLFVLKSDFNSFASVDADFAKIEKLRTLFILMLPVLGAELWDSELRDELDGVGRTILNLNWHGYALGAIGVVLAS